MQGFGESTRTGVKRSQVQPYHPSLPISGSMNSPLQTRVGRAGKYGIGLFTHHLKGLSRARPRHERSGADR